VNDNDNIQIADLAVRIGATHWPTPWDYIKEAGFFPWAKVEGGEIVSSEPGGDGRGGNFHIAAVPNMPEGFDIEPGVSRIGVIHPKARISHPKSLHLPDLLFGLSAMGVWEGKIEAEIKTDLTYLDASDLIRTVDLTVYPFLAWRVQALLLAAIEAGHIPGATMKPGVIGYCTMAERSFVQYTREDDTPEPDDPRITLVRITEDPSLWNDPTGRTRFHV